MTRVNGCYRLIGLVGIAIILVGLLAGCAAPAPTPTATAKPAVAPTPTKAPAPTATPTKVAIRFEGGKFQSLPDGYPSKPINFFVPMPGTGGETLFRNLLKAAQPMSPVPLVMQNTTGGASDFFNKARDTDKTGYAVSYTSGSFISENYVEGHNLVFGKDYVAVVIPSTAELVFTVKADAPSKTMKDFIDYAKANPDLRIGVASSGSMMHVSCEWLQKEAKVKWTCLPHESSPDVLRSILAGDIPGGIIPLGTVAPQVEAGKARILATTGTEKLAKYPDVPRFTDLGYKVQYNHFYGVAAPAEVPKERIQWVSALVVKATENPELRKYVESVGQRVLAYTEDKATVMLKEIDPIVAQLTKELGMRP